MYRRFGKRLFDLALVIPGILILWPIMVILACLVRLIMGTPVLFRQQRPGYGERSFLMEKFRTMSDERHTNGEMCSDTQRLTGFGRWLRSTSLDELPELLAVLRGDMSLVGPRPLLNQYLPHYTAEERRRFTVRPGLTGWAQIHGRNHMAWDDRLACDVWYVDHLSLTLDVRILLLTLHQVMRRHNVAVDPRTVIADLDEQRRDRRQELPLAEETSDGIKSPSALAPECEADNSG